METYRIHGRVVSFVWGLGTVGGASIREGLSRLSWPGGAFEDAQHQVWKQLRAPVRVQVSNPLAAPVARSCEQFFDNQEDV